MCVGLEVSRIIALDNATLNSSFQNCYSIMQSRRSTTGFKTDSLMTAFKSDPYKHIRLNELTESFVVSLPDITGLAAVFHGNSETVCSRIAAAGFVNLRVNPN